MPETNALDKKGSLATEILMYSRNTLLVNLRFLDAALNQFTLTAGKSGTFETDGENLFFTPAHVLETYKTEMTLVTRDFLHIILHCVFQHMYLAGEHESKAWDLACDIAVENAMTELNMAVISSKRELKQAEILERFKREIGVLTAEKIYRYIMRGQPWLDGMDELYTAFKVDEHDIWRSALIKEDELEAEAVNAASEKWHEIARRMQVDMETFGHKQGDRAAAMMNNLRGVNRESVDYTGNIKRFASRNEPMKLDPDEFDSIIYTYGMSLLGNTPLIEPVEYKNVARIRDYVVAVDLFDLVSKKEAVSFLHKTWDVLKSTETHAKKVNFHLLLVLRAGLEMRLIESLSELDEVLDAAKLLKPSDTPDFRAAFLKIDEMVAKREFHELKGFIYFTDGVGAFPAYKPVYETMFVFVNDNYAVPAVPPWAMRLVLQEDEIE